MSSRIEYTKAQKSEALEILEDQGIWAAVAAVGASHTTIYRWHAAYVRSLEKTEEDIETERLENMAMRNRTQRRLLEVAAAHIDRSDAANGARDAKDYMTAAAIALDKYRLEMGEVTNRTDSLSSVDLELQRTIDEFRRQSASPA